MNKYTVKVFRDDTMEWERHKFSNIHGAEEFADKCREKGWYAFVSAPSVFSY